MDFIFDTALETAIILETRSLGFYRHVMSKVKDSTTRLVFELMAKKHAKNLESFSKLYEGIEDKLSRLINRNFNNDPYYHSLINYVDGISSEIDALRIALKEEQIRIDCYTIFVNSMQQQHICAVFEHSLNESRKHMEIIDEELVRYINVEYRVNENLVLIKSST